MIAEAEALVAEEVTEADAEALVEEEAADLDAALDHAK
jgi:hypothetical protein